MESSSEFWSGVMAGVFGTMGLILAFSLLFFWVALRNAPVREDW